MTSLLQGQPAETAISHPSQSSRGRKWELLGLSAILLLTVLLRFTNLESLGYVNHYYTAGVESMLQSWHNFFFAAAEPGGSVTIDKPPVGFWIQAISASLLGVSGFSVLLPELIAGTLSVILLYYLVRRSFGVVPGLLAALALAITPVVVATDRNNTIDSLLILTLLLAAWAFIKATESGKLRYLLLGALLVGVGFNIKMLQAYLPLPAFFALYFLGSRETIGRKLGKLILASLLLVMVSLSWAAIVDLTPTDQRPYVGSSSDNSEINLILVYNGVDRLMGMFGRGRGGGAPGGPVRPANQGQPQDGFIPNRPGNNFGGSARQPGLDGPNPNPPVDGFNPGMNGRQPGNNPPPVFGNPSGNANRNPAGNRGGGMEIGQPGPLRLFVPPLNKEMSWLLPFGIASALLLAFGARLRWPIAPKHQALVLWGLWLVTCAVFFSIAGFFHQYYLSMLAPPLAALVGIGLGELWTLSKARPWLGAGILFVSAVATVAFQNYIARGFVDNVWWLTGIIALLLIGGTLLALDLFTRQQGLRFVLGFGLVAAALFVTPAIWSVLTNLSASQNQSLPAAYSGGRIGPVTQRGLRIDQALLNFLQANTQDVTYLMAVPSSMQGADYVLATGRPVLYMGGFMGHDNVVTANDLARLVGDGELRYIYWNSMGRGMGAQSDISAWVESACVPVQGFDASTQNAGAPDGIGGNAGPGTAGSNNQPFQNSGGPMGIMQVSLFDCAGR